MKGNRQPGGREVGRVFWEGSATEEKALGVEQAEQGEAREASLEKQGSG